MQLFAASCWQGLHFAVQIRQNEACSIECGDARYGAPVPISMPLNAGNDLLYVKFIVFEWHLIYNNTQLTPADTRHFFLRSDVKTRKESVYPGY